MRVSSAAASFASASASSTTTRRRPRCWLTEAFLRALRRRTPAPLDVVEELDQSLEVRLLVVPHREVAAVLADQRARARNEASLAPDVLGVHLVVLRADDERGHGDLRQVRPAVPVLEVARDDELVVALHRVVDLRVDVLEGALDRVRPRVEAADVALVEDLRDHLLVLRRVVRAGRLVLLERRDGILGQRS